LCFRPSVASRRSGSDVWLRVSLMCGAAALRQAPLRLPTAVDVTAVRSVAVLIGPSAAIVVTGPPAATPVLKVKARREAIPLEPAAEGIVAEAPSKMTTDPMAAVAMRRYHTSGHGRLQKATAAARPRMFLRIHLFFCDGRCRISWSPHYRELSLPRAVISDRLTASKLNPCLSRLSTACPREQ
jgi:hypothetical protein